MSKRDIPESALEISRRCVAADNVHGRQGREDRSLGAHNASTCYTSATFPYNLERKVSERSSDEKKLRTCVKCPVPGWKTGLLSVKNINLGIMS